MSYTLYIGNKNASSWAMRAWLALREAGVEFEEVLVDIRRPQRYGNLARIGELSPSASVPVLATDRTIIHDSLAIMEFANDACGGRLLPEDDEVRAQARSLSAWQHAGLSSLCRRISFESAFYPVRRALTHDEQAQCARLFAHYDALLHAHGGPFLFGGISLADLMHVPTIVRLRAHDPELERWPAADAWSRRLLTYPLVREWMAQAETLPHIWFDDYLEQDAWPSSSAAR